MFIKPYGGIMSNNVTTKKPVTIKGYKVNGNNVILTPTQFVSFEANYEMMGKHTFDTIEHANNSVQYSRNENKQRSPNYKPKQTNFNY